ncbi:MAG: 4'-phosphopantetheinyl transferase superfamily protein [Candidatus Poseidoniales archaeon]
MSFSVSEDVVVLDWTNQYPCRVLSCMAPQRELLQDSLLLVNAEEVQTFATDKRRKDHFNGRWLLQYALEVWGGIALDAVEVLRTELREPYLRYIQGVWKNEPLPSFSISHSDDQVFVALCESGYAIGIDAEPVGRTISEGVFDLMSSGDELDVLRQQPSLALQYWTMKEAVQKSAGMGMHLNPRKIKIPIGKKVCKISIDNLKIQLENIEFNDYFVSLAITERSTKPQNAEDDLLEATKIAMQDSEWTVGCATVRKNA